VKTRIPVSASALIAGAAIAQMPIRTGAFTAGDKLTHEPVGITAASLSQVSPGDGQESFETRIVVAPAQEWTPRLEQRFLRLAEKEALGKLSLDEARRLEELTTLRNALKVPRSGEEVLREYEQRKVTNDLVVALQRYVQFYKAPGHSKA
jgi:hypothetical protein